MAGVGERCVSADRRGTRKRSAVEEVGAGEGRRDGARARIRDARGTSGDGQQDGHHCLFDGTGSDRKSAFLSRA